MGGPGGPDGREEQEADGVLPPWGGEDRNHRRMAEGEYSSAGGEATGERQHHHLPMASGAGYPARHPRRAFAEREAAVTPQMGSALQALPPRQPSTHVGGVRLLPLWIRPKGRRDRHRGDHGSCPTEGDDVCCGRARMRPALDGSNPALGSPQPIVGQGGRGGVLQPTARGPVVGGEERVLP